MKKGVWLIVFSIFLGCLSVSNAAPILNTSCSKLGAFKSTGPITYVCAHPGKKLLWIVFNKKQTSAKPLPFQPDKVVPSPTPSNSPSVNKGPIINGAILPGGITNFTAAWAGGITNFTAVWDGDNLVFTFNCDPTASQNKYLSNFYFLFTPTGSSTQYAWSPQSTQVNNSGSTQTITFTPTDNTNTFNTQVTIFSAISVSSQDGFGRRGDYVSLGIIPTYSSGLPIP
jgi:hypothetical protein